ncbi:MAG: carbohydrate-binding family 9-like protein [Planctomycetes bacterium]|nr:carbohydrate-binding family 9-like protein [Planctomycetota bacterium]
MIRRSRAWLLALFVLAGCQQDSSYAPWPRELAPGTVRRYPCRYTMTPPVLDGLLEDAVWTNAPWSEPFLDITGSGPIPKYGSWMKMLWDDKNLYIAAFLQEPDLWGTYDRRDMMVYHENDFEVFLDPDGDHDSYYEIEVNVIGTVLDLYLNREYRLGGQAHTEWNCEGMDGAIDRVGTLNDSTDVDEGWAIEIMIPFKCLRPPVTVTDDAAENVRNGDTPVVGEMWRMNFSRVQWPLEKVPTGYVKLPGSKEENWVWTPQWAVNMHQIDHWGQVTFTK